MLEGLGDDGAPENANLESVYDNVPDKDSTLVNVNTLGQDGGAKSQEEQFFMGNASNPSTPLKSYQTDAAAGGGRGTADGLDLRALETSIDSNLNVSMDSEQYTPVRMVIDRVMNTPKGIDLFKLENEGERSDLSQFPQPSSFGSMSSLLKDEKSFPDDDNIEEFRSIMVAGNRLEITDLCELFLGLSFRNIYSSILGIYMYGTLTAYLTIFVSSLSSNIVIFDDSATNQGLFTFLFFFCTVPISCLEFNEQVEWQVSLAICRGVLVVIMVLSCIITQRDGSNDNGFYFNNYPDAPYGAPLSNVGGFITLFPLAGYANIFQHSIPALGFPVENKKEIAAIFVTAILVLLIAYSSMGSILCYFFGSSIPSSSNLAWSEFQGRGQMYSFIASIISLFVVLFPALDVASAYPLNAITLGNSMITTFKDNVIYLPFMTRKLKKKELRIMFRLLASSPPFIVTMVCSNFETIVSFSGLVGFFIAMIIPALLARASKKRLLRKKLNPDTPYTSVLTSDTSIHVMIALGTLMTLLVTITTIL